ncbi:hypothetical protein QR680_017036 [Steinernema hermaphroditum]|uniref:Uncharacterized protein n=1 Tax=Steinernema hermaphroditum TaxID=289476 RepID=A0AA39LMX7_9BILA|nr:hypothetical protein QR680_017036 [Steinernema hermaphroditum]
MDDSSSRRSSILVPISTISFSDPYKYIGHRHRYRWYHRCEILSAIAIGFLVVASLIVFTVAVMIAIKFIEL